MVEAAGHKPNRAGSRETLIQPRRGLFDWRLGELWRSRELIGLFVWRDFVSVYKQTILGPAWHILQPLCRTVVYTVVFSRAAGLSTDGAPPFLFYLVGTIAWTYFEACLDSAAKTFTVNHELLSKVHFHRLVMPVSAVLSNLIALAIQLSIFLAFLGAYLYSGTPVHFTGWLLATPVLIGILAGYGLGVGILVCALTTRYRDLRHVATFGVQLLMFLTPVIYPISVVPAGYRWFVDANPLTPIFESLRLAFLGTGTVTMMQVAASGVLMLVVLAVGVALFVRVERSFIDTV